MSVVMEEEINRWTARRKSALVLEIIQGKTTVAAASWQFDLTPAEIENLAEDGKRGMENALKAQPEDVREQYERQLKDLRRKRTATPCWNCVLEKVGVPVGEERELILSIQQGLQMEGCPVAVSPLCRWFGVPLRAVYYRTIKALPNVRPEWAEPTKAVIEQEASFGYRTVAGLLGMNNNSVQRIAQKPFLLRSDNGLVFTRRQYTRLVRSSVLQQEFITPHCPQQNGLVERVIRTSKEQCVHRHPNCMRCASSPPGSSSRTADAPKRRSA